MLSLSLRLSSVKGSPSGAVLSRQRPSMERLDTVESVVQAGREPRVGIAGLMIIFSTST